MQVDFYHLASAPVERVLPRIAERIVAGGGRLLVVAEDDAPLLRLDRALWSYDPYAFLPHGRAGAGGEGRQPVLLSATPDPVNGARNIALVDGVWRAEALGYDRAFHLFDDDAIESARAAWRGLADAADAERRFWRQEDDGRWARMA